MLQRRQLSRTAYALQVSEAHASCAGGPIVIVACQQLEEDVAAAIDSEPHVLLVSSSVDAQWELMVAAWRFVYGVQDSSPHASKLAKQMQIMGQTLVTAEDYELAQQLQYTVLMWHGRR